MRRIEVEWIDSNIIHGWQSSIEDCNVALTQEVGYLIHEDDEKIVLARGISTYGFFNSPMAIPKGCIRSIKELRIK